MTDDVALKSRAVADASATMTGQFGLSDLHSGDVLAGRFRIHSILGIGGMGVVYRAEDQALGVEVAVKLLRPELARRPEAFERFRQELLLARQVSSPHVVRIHDIAQHEGRWFISMDFVDGESLESKLDGAGKLPTDEALGIARGLLDGLTAAQLRGVVHRDLKPANILLDRSGSAYITDFGVARSLGATGVTQSGVIVGTPEYLSPEQARGEAVDTRSDLYAVGLIVYEMLTGKLPFNSGTPAETVMQRIVRQPPSLAIARPDLPRWLHAFCDRLLKLNPAHRFATPQEALRALETRKVPRQPLNRRALLLSLLACVALAGAGVWLWRRPQQAVAPLVAPTIARVAVLPFSSSANDSDAENLARALEAHLHAWVRSDATVAVIERRRVLDAITRTAPDSRGDTIVRLLPGILNAASANRGISGEVLHADSRWSLRLSATQAGEGKAQRELKIEAPSPPALFSAYEQKAGAFLAENGTNPLTRPELPASHMLDFGKALLALDHDKPEEAANIIGALGADAVAPSALIDSVMLTAQERAQQELPLQNTREAAIHNFDKDSAPWARELVGQALTGSDQADAALRVLAQAVHDYPRDPALALLNAEALRTKGEGKRALAVLQDYVKLDDDDSRAWFQLGRTAIEQGDAQSAVENYLQHAQMLSVRARDIKGEAETRNAIGIGYERLGQLDAAAEQYSRAVAIREKLNDQPGLAKSLRNLAIVQAEQGKRSEAEQTLVRVKGLLEKLGDRGSIADLYNDSGVVAEERGDFAQALDFYRQALALRQQLDVPSLVAESLDNVAYSSFQLGQYDNALVFWQQALAQFTKLDDRTRILHIQQSVAMLNVARGHFAEARASLQDSLQKAEDHQLPEEGAIANLNLGELSLTEGRLGDALASADRAAQLLARRSDPRGQAEAALLKARVFIALGDAANGKSVLDSIDQQHLNGEQRTAYLLTDARRAAIVSDRALEQTQLDLASVAATQAHSGALDAQIQLERVRLAMSEGAIPRASTLLAALSKETIRLNEVPLRLAWSQLQMAVALRASKPAEAITRYRDVLSLLKGAGRYRDSTLLHRFGELALSGKTAEAAAAAAAAAATRTQLIGGAPADARSALNVDLDRRWREESGHEH